MCIGIPMQVMETHQFHALCLDANRQVKVDTRLLSEVHEGEWLLVFLGAAREKLDIETALRMRDAVNAVNNVMSGDHRIEHLFDDLIDREPPVPDHLKHLIGG